MDKLVEADDFIYKRLSKALQITKDDIRKVQPAFVRSKRAIKRLYGLSAQQYEDLWFKQKGVCAICEQECRSGNELAIDHCHKTGVVRGLLCGSCNTAIGHMRDDVEILKRAIKYLEDSNASSFSSSKTSAA